MGITSPLGIYILGSFLTALLVALFQYRPWQTNARYRWVLTLCRALSLASLVLLLVNPKTVSKTTVVVPPKLSILLDNSQSIKHLNKAETMVASANRLKNHPALNQKFDLQTYSFGAALSLSDSLDFTAKQSNIGGSLQALNAITTDEGSAVVLLSDGNQTVGPSYVHYTDENGASVYPLVLGDSVQYMDLSVKQINVNSFTFLGNEFPVELVLNYKGNSTVKTQLKILSGTSTIYSKPVTFSADKPTQVVTPYLNAKSPGIQRFRVQLNPLSDERLTTNNVKDFGIEVIDQTFKIALISDQSHPDLAALKAIATAQKQYALQRFTPDEFLNAPNAFDLVVLYQPNRSFQRIFEVLDQQPLNSFVVAGPQSDWTFLNAAQSIFNQEITSQIESYQAVLNPNFDAFSADPLPFEEFPPLKASFGQTKVAGPHEVLLYKTVAGTSTDTPLLFTYKSGRARHAVFLAEHLWKWRLYAYKRQQSFGAFDAFFGTLFQYLSTQKASDPLKISHDAIFDGSSPLAITAQYFNDNFEPNTTAELNIEVQSKELKSPLKFPMLLDNTSYRADLSSLEPGRYDYTVRVQNNKLSKTGQFEILPFNIETQVLNANLPMLTQLAKETGGQVFLDTQVQSLIDALVQEERFKSIQKIDKKTVPLIEFKMLLLLLLLSLAMEWFLRKYFGLI